MVDDLIERLKSYQPGPGGIDSQFNTDIDEAIAALKAEQTRQDGAQSAVPDGMVLVPEDSLISVLQLAGLVVPETDLNSSERAHFGKCCDAIRAAKEQGQ